MGVTADKYEHIKGVLTITASTLREVSLVTDPAIASAKVSVAANLEDNSVPLIQEESDKPTTTKPEGDEVETTPTVPEASAETVEAASQNVQASTRPVFFTKPRSPINSDASYLEHTIRATFNPNSDSALWVRAADDTMTSVAGFNPTPPKASSPRLPQSQVQPPPKLHTDRHDSHLPALIPALAISVFALPMNPLALSTSPPPPMSK